MLTPSKIKNHHFEAAGKNAYRAQSVDDFFEIVADSYEQMFKENGELVKKIGLLAERVEEYRNDEDNIRAALLTAQRMADQIMRETNEKSEAQLAEAASSAKKQEEEAALKAKTLLDKAQSKADLLIAETQQKAQQMIEDATAEAKEQAVIARDRMIKTQAALDLVEKEADKFKRELLSLYTEHIELINKIPEVQEEPEEAPIEETDELIAEEAEVKEEEPTVESVAEPEEANGVESEPEAETEPAAEETVAEPSEESAQEETTYTAPAEEAAAENVIEEPEEELSDSDFERLGLKTPIASQESADEAKETEDFKNKFKDAFADMREQVKQPEDTDDDVKAEEPANDGFKFDINSLNFKDDDEEDEEYFDDDDDDDDFYDDDDDDEEDEDDGFSSKLKGFFKR